jgi:hypothetical protein
MIRIKNIQWHYALDIVKASDAAQKNQRKGSVGDESSDDPAQPP